MNALMGGMGGGIQIANLGAAFDAGREAYNQNALRSAMQQYGAAAMNGDQNALAQLAQFDPQLGMQLMKGQQDMRLADRQDERSERKYQHEVGIDNQRLELAREEGRRAASEHGAKMDALQRQQAMDEAERFGKAASVALQNGTWDRFLQTPGLPDELKGVSAEDAPYAIALFSGVTEGLTGSGEMPAEFRTLDARARAAGFDPGTPQYQEFMAKGPIERTEDVTQTFRLLTPEEQAAGQFPPGSQVDQKTGRVYPADTRDTTTEGERKASGFLSRMEAAESIIGGLAASGHDRFSLGERAMGAIPFMPEGVALGPESEKLAQAQRDWVRSKLRMESGAVIGDEEMAEEIRTYFPQIGEDPEVVKQKAQARQEAIEAMRQMAGRAQKKGDTPRGAPPIGTVEEGHRYIGGPPDQPSSWERVD